MTDPQVRQLAEQLAKLHTFMPGNGGWGKRCAKCGETENFKDHRSAEVVIGTALSVFATHTRREVLGEAGEVIKQLLRSAYPNQKEHPTMFVAWKRATEFLDNEAIRLLAEEKK